jgi:uroporphyrinogen decarboxylase
MNHKQRVIGQIEHLPTDVIPYYLSFDDDCGLERGLDLYFGSKAWRDLIDNAIEFLPLPSEALVADPGDEIRWRDLYGTVWRCDVRPRHIIAPALPRPSMDGYFFPSMSQIFDKDWQARAWETIEACDDRFLLATFGYGLFERSWTMRGFENALADIVLHRTFYGELLEQITFHQLEILARLLELPVDGIFFSDDWGYQDGVLIGAPRWQEMLKPRLARLYGRVHEGGKYVLTHCCGSIVEILPDLIEIGLDVYESVQPEAKGNDPYELKRRFGEYLTFWGGLGSQSILPFGSRGEIRLEIRRLCRQMGKGGGYILAPAKSLQPGTPVENAAAVVEGFLEQSGVKLEV